MKRVLCSAYVSPETDSEEEIEYDVEVNGEWDHSGITATYKIMAKTQKDAAMQGMNRFSEENQ
jgi:hypothetical protein